MKISWRYKIVLFLMIGIVSAIVITWILNRSFLEDYYLYNKMQTLDTAYRSVMGILETKEAFADEDWGSLTSEERQQFFDSFLSEEEKLTFELLNVKSGLEVYLLWNGVYCSATGDYGRQQQLSLLERIRAYLYPGSSVNYEVERKLRAVRDDYEVFYVYDGRVKSNYVELFHGETETGNYVIIRTSVESMQESVAIANQFLAYAGTLVTIIVSFLMFFATKSVVRPIQRMSAIAKRMTNLDFDAKCPVQTRDEIGELGSSINVLSETLESTISDLKNANNQLQTDIVQKVQIDEMRKEFLSNVTHELKTPIALIQGYAEGLKDNINEDEESRNFYCDVIIDEAGKMNKMVQKLLTLNQIEFGSQAVEMERFDLDALIRSVLNSSDILIRQQQVQLFYEQNGPLEVWADEYLIEEVFTNYLTNAIHYADRERIIEIRAVRKERSVRVSVFNSGMPIPEEELDKIWVKFYKADKARTREYGGSGIGLSIVKAVMEAHNQPYGVVNHSNGVEFWFEMDAGNGVGR